MSLDQFDWRHDLAVPRRLQEPDIGASYYVRCGRPQPTAAERASAAGHKIRGYHTLFSGSTGQGQAGVNTLANSLAANTPVAISIPIRAGFNNLRGAGVDSDNSTAILGYHEILAIGYDQSGLLIQNSWGTGWGDNGRFRMRLRTYEQLSGVDLKQYRV